jgi:orotidine-5'-phosphate decarboxylase
MSTPAPVMGKAAREHLALAADLPLVDALRLATLVAPHVGVVKVGLSLFVEHGPRAVEQFLATGARVFLDLKLHDIPNTVELAAAKAAALGVSYLTVHASGGAAMLEAALRGAAKGASAAGVPAPQLLAVTVLTSMDEAALRSIGVSRAPDEQVLALGRLAVSAGCSGLVCSAREARALRQALGAGVVLCTPGIRPAGVAANDQARVETPASAIAAGADLLVIGRPISEAKDPVQAAAAIEAELAAALKQG